MPRPWASGVLILDAEVATCTRGYWGYRFMLAPPVDTMRPSARAWCWPSSPCSPVAVGWETFAARKRMGCQRRWQTRGGASPCIWIAASLFWKSTPGSSLGGQVPTRALQAADGRRPAQHHSRPTLPRGRGGQAVKCCRCTPDERWCSCRRPPGAAKGDTWVAAPRVDDPAEDMRKCGP